MKQYDKHIRRTRPARYHDNRRIDNGMDDWTLDEIRKRIRGDDAQTDDRNEFEEGEADGTAAR